MVGLLIISHNKVGEALFDAATSVLGTCPLQFKILSVSQNCEPEELFKKAQTYMSKLIEEDNIDNILVITDMYGSTPSNIATKLATDNVAIITGLNLPMLVRIMNYPDLSLEELTNKALNAGQTGIIIV